MIILGTRIQPILTMAKSGGVLVAWFLVLVILTPMQPIILHLDMNSYFASVEQQDHLEWRGKPVGVCEHLGGIIIAASVEAKKWGIKTGTPVWEARKMYPKIILTPTSPSRYRFYTRRLIKLVEDYTDKVEVYSIDEVFLDLTKACNISLSTDQLVSLSAKTRVDPYEEAERIAREIKKRMKKEVGDYVRCSVGIGPNKLIAKIASDMQKPDGLVVVREGSLCHPGSLECSRKAIRDPELGSSAFRNEQLKTGSRISSDALGFRDDAPFNSPLYFTKFDLYRELKLTDIPGIGHRQEKNLNALGIKTLLDLKNYPKSKLVARFGLPGYHLYAMGQLEGSWKPAVEQDNHMKSIGHMYTLPKEYRESKWLEPVLYKLSEMVARRMRRQGLWGNILHFHVHDHEYKGFGKSEKLGRYLDDGREIFREAARIVKTFSIQSINLKLIGITMAGLRERDSQQSLFGVEEKTQRIDEALDKIDEKYGDFTVCRLPVKLAGKVFHDSIGFGRIKELGRSFQARDF